MLGISESHHRVSGSGFRLRLASAFYALRFLVHGALESHVLQVSIEPETLIPPWLSSFRADRMDIKLLSDADIP